MMNVFMDAIDKAKNENKDIDPLWQILFEKF